MPAPSALLSRCGIGIGYDTHRLVPGRKLIIGGIEIPSELGALAHSDGDVLAHAVTDALLGAARLGNIGQHFPDTDPKWLNAGSLAFLSETARLLRQRRLAIVFIDSVVVLDKPKLAPHLEKMAERLGSALGIPAGRISIKPKTSEGVTPELTTAHAVALLAPEVASRAIGTRSAPGRSRDDAAVKPGALKAARNARAKGVVADKRAAVRASKSRSAKLRTPAPARSLSPAKSRP